MSELIKPNLHDEHHEHHHEVVDEETGHYWLGLFYFIGIIVAITGIFFIISFIVSPAKDDKPATTTQSNYESTIKEDKRQDDQPKSKDSSEMILVGVANKILEITGDPKTECSMPVFNKDKQYWITNCDYQEKGDKKTDRFSIQLNNVNKLEK